MSKMGSHDPIRYLKHKLWPKERSWVKFSIWLPTTKRWESPSFPSLEVACHILLKSSWQGLQLWFRPHLNRRSTHKVMGLQRCESPNFGNFPSGSPRTKWHLGAGPMAKHREYYKGDGGGFPQVWAVVNLVNLCLSMARSCTKSVMIMH
jgi:hypothetical protein